MQRKKWSLYLPLVVLAIAASTALVLAAASRMTEPGETTGTGGPALIPPNNTSSLLSDVGREAGPSYGSHAVKATEAYIRNRASKEGGSFELRDAATDQMEKLSLVRVDKDSVRVIGRQRYLVQADFRLPDGKFCAVDFILIGSRPNLLKVDRAFIQELDGQPRYAWKHEGKRWMAERLEIPSTEARTAPASYVAPVAYRSMGSESTKADKTKWSSANPPPVNTVQGVVSAYVDKKSAGRGYFEIRDPSSRKMVRLSFDQLEPDSLRMIGKDRWLARAEFHSSANIRYGLDFILSGTTPAKLGVRQVLIQQVNGKERYCWKQEGMEWRRMALRAGEHCTA